MKMGNNVIVYQTKRMAELYDPNGFTVRLLTIHENQQVTKIRQLNKVMVVKRRLPNLSTRHLQFNFQV